MLKQIKVTPLAEAVPVTVLGHHVLRDENWENRCQPVFDAANSAGNKVVTATEFSGEENRFFEFRRRQLFETDPPCRVQSVDEFASAEKETR